jgi:hypothetical protein
MEAVQPPLLPQAKSTPGYSVELMKMLMDEKIAPGVRLQGAWPVSTLRFSPPFGVFSMPKRVAACCLIWCPRTVLLLYRLERVRPGNYRCLSLRQVSRRLARERCHTCATNPGCWLRWLLLLSLSLPKQQIGVRLGFLFFLFFARSRRQAAPSSSDV